MDVTQRLLVKRTAYEDDGMLAIHVLPQLVDGDGNVVGSGQSVFMNRLEADAIAAGVARGRTDGEWGNKEIEDLIFADQVIDQPARLSIEATFKPRFTPGTLVAWRA